MSRPGPKPGAGSPSKPARSLKSLGISPAEPDPRAKKPSPVQNIPEMTPSQPLRHEAPPPISESETSASERGAGPPALPVAPRNYRAAPLRTVLLMGETGSGKSTIINTLANYFLKGTLRKPRVVIPNKIYRQPTETEYSHHSEANLDDTTVSQTKECITYTFSLEGITYKIIDTPGLSDTSLTENHSIDDINVERILTAASKAKELHAIILIINGSTPRLTVNLRNALQRIKGNYPDVLLSNMLVIFTHTSMSIPTFEKSSLPHPPREIFTMDNMAFCSRPDQWNADDAEFQELCWKQSMRKAKQIVDFIDQLAPQCAEVFGQMRDSRNEIKNQILRSLTEIEKLQQLVECLERLKRDESAITSSLSREQASARTLDQEAQYYALQVKQNQDDLDVAEKDEKSLQDKAKRFATRVQATGSQMASKQQALEEAKKSQMSESDFHETTTITYKKMDVTSYHNTNCVMHKKTCHENCSLGFQDQLGSEDLKVCACMNSESLCTGCGCGVNAHVHGFELYSEVTESVETINQAKKNQYLQQIQNLRDLEVDLVHQQGDKAAAEMEISRCNALLEQVNQHTSGIRGDKGKLQAQKVAAEKKKRVAENAINAANQQKSQIQAQVSVKESELQEANRKLKEAQAIVEAKCRELKAICSGFNFVDELNLARQSLRQSLATLKTTEARDNAQAFIDKLGQLATGLTEGGPR